MQKDEAACAPCTEPSDSMHVASSQRQHIPVPRAQHSSERSYFKVNPSSLSADEVLSSKAAMVEWMWQLEIDSIAPSATLTSTLSRDEGLFVWWEPFSWNVSFEILDGQILDLLQEIKKSTVPEFEFRDVWSL